MPPIRPSPGPFLLSLLSLLSFSYFPTRAPWRDSRAALWADLLLNLVRDQLPDRPHRQESRAVKRRPKPYPWLTKPRHQFKAASHNNRYWKNKPRNFKRLN